MPDREHDPAASSSTLPAVRAADMRTLVPAAAAAPAGPVPAPVPYVPPPAPPSFPPASAVFQAAADPSRTVYGPAIVGTMRVEDPAAIAALHALRAPDVPRPAPAAVRPSAAAGELTARPAPPSSRALLAVIVLAAVMLALSIALAITL